ncbi:MAG: multicopper oxidase domain-containing protein [Syntrophales bacterium]|nr:multicopper oxidase domain-containing protein [Syntrophales bacterium]
MRSLAAAVAALIFLMLSAPPQVQGAMVEYDLTIARQAINVTGKPSEGMTINGGSPGPTLRFREGDLARIRVHNRMGEDTSIHWHGILVPPGMDGVPYLSFPPIRPGETFTYEFPIRQNGTYWYHSHTHLQEQSGVYGSIVIEPLRNGPKPDRDHVVVLSEWTDEDPRTVNRTLKRGSHWYAFEKGSAQSIVGAARLGMLGDYFLRELQRMPAMDISDVAYDRFLANGKPDSTLPAGPREKVLLRVINSSSSTYFHLEFAGGPMTIVAADGQDVEPVRERRLLVGVAETYDLLVQIPAAGAYEFRATAHDGSGYASVWLGSGERHPAPEVPRPNLYHGMGHLGLQQIFSLTPAGTMGMPDGDVDAGRFDRPGMAGMDSMEMDHSNHAAPAPASPPGGMDHGGHTMPMPAPPPEGMDHSGHATPSAPPAEAVDHDGHTLAVPVSSPETMDHGAHDLTTAMEGQRSGKRYGTHFGFLAADVSASRNLAVDGTDPRPWPPYARLRATQRTAFSEKKPLREIRLTLDGDMERYVWFFNNRTLDESDAIRIRQGEAVRFILINRTMMHHPIHLHGHFFRVINDQGDYAPLKHTVDVAPMSTTVIEFDANEVGDWFFHCHLLYHMQNGMARVVEYEGFAVDPQLAALRPGLSHEAWYAWGQADVLSNMTEGYLRLANTRNILTAEWEWGWQGVDKSEWETFFTWDRYINRFFKVFAGVNLEGVRRELEENRAVFGIRYLLPLNLESRTWIDSDGGARIHLEKTFELTPRLALRGEAEYDTRHRWEGGAALTYLIHKDVSLVGRWHSDFGFGGGLQIRF